MLAVTGTVTPAEAALRGVGNNAVIALAAIFVLSAGLKESGGALFQTGVAGKLAATLFPAEMKLKSNLTGIGMVGYLQISII